MMKKTENCLIMDLSLELSKKRYLYFLSFLLKSASKKRIIAAKNVLELEHELLYRVNPVNVKSQSVKVWASLRFEQRNRVLLQTMFFSIPI